MRDLGRANRVGPFRYRVAAGRRVDGKKGRRTCPPPRRRELECEVGILDGPAVEHPHRSGEQVGALEEERSFLRIEEREALVGRALRLVRLNLREVGIHGKIHGRCRRQAQPGRAAKAQ